MQTTWTQTEIGGKPADVYDPPGGQKPRFGILYLHGHGLETLHDRPAFTHLFEELKLACVCPHGQRSWWGDRVCAEFDPRISAERYLLDQVIPFFQQRWGLAPRAIGLTGISMGGQGVLRLAFKYPHLFPVVGAISSAIDCYELYGQGYTIDRSSAGRTPLPCICTQPAFLPRSSIALIRMIPPGSAATIGCTRR
jgi:S-formylglutathione hydrolase